MTEKIVYLDQNKWIDLAREEHGKDASHRQAAALAAIKAARDQGRACFPLSIGHYMETLKNSDPGRRQRLGAVMRDISDGRTIAPPEVIVPHELDVALARRFGGRVVVTPLAYLGKGVRHAQGKTGPLFRLEGGDLSDEQRDMLLAHVDELAEDALLSGVLPYTGEERPRLDFSVQGQAFQKGLDKWVADAASKTPAELEELILAVTLADIEKPLWASLARHRIEREEFALLGKEGWRSVLQDMPSRRVDMHLRREWARNPSLKAKESELNDWVFVGAATSYCDVVVTENLTASLLNRRGLQKRAVVITDLAELPGLLAG